MQGALGDALSSPGALLFSARPAVRPLLFITTGGEGHAPMTDSKGHSSYLNQNDDDESPCETSDPAGREVVASSSSLDPYRISVENRPGHSPEQDWRFRFASELRSTLLDSLFSLTLTQKQRDRFQSCGSHAWVQHSASAGKYSGCLGWPLSVSPKHIGSFR